MSLGKGGWDYHEAIGDVLAHKPSTQPEVNYSIESDWYWCDWH